MQHLPSIKELARSVKWAIFDLDVTLITPETFIQLSQHAGVHEQVASITRQSLEGSYDVHESVLKRCALLKGVSRSVWPSLYDNICYTEGARELFGVLRLHGIKTAIISGGFMEMAEYVGEYMQADFVMANKLEYDAQGRTTGQVLGDIVDGHKKRDFLLHLSGGDAMAIGDGANDIPMIQTAKLGIAFMGKPKVREVAHYCIDEPNMWPIVNFFDF